MAVRHHVVINNLWDRLVGLFRDVEATPMEMIVDARTMKIVKITEGWVTKGNGSLWSDLDGLLAH